jgi:purine-binding chemotaxis protein CheW
MTSNNASLEQSLDDNTKNTAEVQQFLSFTLSNESYGVDLMSVREIKGWSQTTRLPNSPEFMKGVINLRGVVVPIFDLRKRFGMGNSEPNEKNAVIIVAVDKRIVGILVDAVSDILDATSNEISQAPQMESKVDADFIKGLISIEDKMVVLLDVNKIFDLETLQIAEKATKESNNK